MRSSKFWNQHGNVQVTVKRGWSSGCWHNVRCRLESTIKPRERSRWRLCQASLLRWLRKWTHSQTIVLSPGGRWQDGRWSCSEKWPQVGTDSSWEITGLIAYVAITESLQAMSSVSLYSLLTTLSPDHCEIGFHGKPWLLHLPEYVNTSWPSAVNKAFPASIVENGG